MIKLNKKLLLGGSSSSIQNDGNHLYTNAKTNFHILYKEYREMFFDQVGPDVTNNFILNYKKDLKMLKEIGFEIYRHSFNWAMLFPNGMDEKPNQKAVIFYHDLIAEMKLNNIKPMMTIAHFDLPDYICQKGGLVWEGYANEFSKLASFIFNEYGAELDYIATFNEPFVQCSHSYLYNGDKGHWPLEYNVQKFLTSCENIVIANALAIKESKKIALKAKIGIVLDVSPGVVRNPDYEDDLKALKYYDAYKEDIFTYPTIRGEIPETLMEMIDILKLKSQFKNKEIIELIKDNTISWLGVNYYTRGWVKATKVKNPQSFEDFYEKWNNPIMLMNNSRWWEIAPEMLSIVGDKIKNEFNNIEWFVTENGIGIENEFEDYSINDKIIDDYRIRFIEAHLEELNKIVANGANCKGYLMWTPIDSWSFMNAYKNRYGLIAIDLKTQKRSLKKSASWWKEVFEMKNK